MWVDSLEAPLGNSTACYADFLPTPEQAEPKQQPDFSRLYEAIKALTPKQQQVIVRHFGLDGDAPESNAALSRRLATANGMLARNRYNLAIRSLRRKLLHSA